MTSPSNPLSELSVLSLMMREDRLRRTILGEGISPDHFTGGRKPVFMAIERMFRAGRSIDAVTVSAEVARDGYLDEAGGPDGIAEIERYAPSSDNLSDWLSVLRDARALRIAHDAASMLSEANDSGEAEATATAALEAMKEARSGPKRSLDALESAKRFQAHIERLAANGELPGISTGIDPLDIISGGMKPGELWVSLGQTSRGKSVLMLQIAAHVAASGKRVAIFSAEMMGNQVFGRLVSNKGPLRMGAVTQPMSAGAKERDRMMFTMQRLAEMQFWIDDTPGMTLEHIEAESMRIADAHGPLDLIVADYLQIIKIRKERNENREQEVARISSGLKQLAKARGCPVLTGGQLNKKMEARESNAIEFDADALLAICEEGIKVMKLRDGRRDDILPLTLNGEYQRFERSHS